MEYTPEEIKILCECYHELMGSYSSMCKFKFQSGAIQRKFAENAKIRLSDFREKVSEDLVSLFSPKLEEIEIEIEAAQKPSAFVHTVEPDKRGKFFNAGDSHADCAYE